MAITSESGNRDTYRVETPAYSKFEVKEILMKATRTGARRVHVSVTSSKQEPCLEFSEKEIKTACDTGLLPIPLATVVTRSKREALGYKSILLTKPEHFRDNRISDFLVNDGERDAYEGLVARELQRHVEYQAQTRGRRGNTLLTINIAPPDEGEH